MDTYELKARMAETQRIMARNLAENIYAETPLMRLLRENGRKPVKWTWGSELHKWRGRLGRVFLRIANSLGEYNDYD